MSDYWKKKLEELNQSTSTSSNPSTNYWQSRMTALEDAERKKKYDDAIAPISAKVRASAMQEEEEEKKWYESGLFEDGYDFGDITKTILGISDKKELKTFTAPETTDSLETLKQKQNYYKGRTWNTAEQTAESLKTTQQYNQKALYEYSQTLSKTKMDGQSHSVLEEIEILANMEKGEEKDKRKAKVLAKMEELGMDTEFYAHFAGDGEFDWDTFGKWLSNSALAGLGSFNKGLLDTADVLLGAPMKALGWENNPISKGAEYYNDLYSSFRYDANIYAEKLGGNAWNFGTDAVEGTIGALPNALLLFMTGGQSATASTSSLMNTAAMQTGNILTKAGLTTEQMLKNPQFWVSFSRTLGGEYQQAKEDGASDTAAAIGSILSSMIQSGIEIGLDGGSGIQGLPDGLNDGKPLMEWVESSIEEGGEEILQKFVGEVISKVGYGSDKEILNPIEYAKEGTLGVLSGAALGGGQMTVSSGVNAFNEYQVNKLTDLEKGVAKKLVEKEVAKRESQGKTVSASDKKSIEKSIDTKLRKGYISVEDIEEAIGGEAYDTFKTEMENFTRSDQYQNYRKTVKDANKRIEKMQKQLESLANEPNTVGNAKKYDAIQNRIDLLRKRTQAMKESLMPESNRIMGLRNQMRSQVMETVKDSRLAESYRELGRKKQKFQVDINKYTNENARKTVQSILDSGLGDNSNQFHDTVEWLARLSEDKNVTFNLTNNEALKGTEHYKEGYITHGFVNDDGDIMLNKDSDRVLNTTVGHEITHVLEEAGIYDQLSQAMRDFCVSKEGIEAYNARIAEAEAIYKGKKNTTAEKEVTADLIGEYIFTDSDFINNLSTSNRGLFERLRDEVHYLWKVATAGSKEARELERVKRLFDKAWRENIQGKGADTKTENETQTDADEASDAQGVQYSVTVDDKKTLDFLDEQLRNGEVTKVYRAMQVQPVDENGEVITASVVRVVSYSPLMVEAKTFGKDGKVDVYPAKLFSPMAGMVNGKWSKNIELNKWEQTTYDLANATTVIDPKTGQPKIDTNKKNASYGEIAYYYGLVKGGLDDDGKKLTDVPARYNPYIHTSLSALNDQFSSANKRPELVTVECIIPNSELTSGERAEGAKDRVGAMSWHSGPTSSRLAKVGKARTVILTRYDMPLRVLPDSEVAKAVADYIGDTENIAIQGSTVTPSLSRELMNLGISVLNEEQWAQYSKDFPTKTFGKQKSGKTKYSYSSIANSFFGKDMGTDEFFNEDYHQTEGYQNYVEECVNNLKQSNPNLDVDLARASVQNSIDGIVRVAVAAKKAGYDIADDAEKRTKTDSKKRLLFSSLEPNSDYFTSHDISTICDKRKNFAEIYDEIVRIEESKNVPKGKRFFDNVDNYFAIHDIMARQGLTTPCRQCYVESMRKNLAPMAKAFLDLVQETDPNNISNPQLWAKASKDATDFVIGEDGKRYAPKASNTTKRENVLKAFAEEGYDIGVEDLTIEMLTTAEGLAQLRLQAPLVYEAFNSFYGQAKPKMPKQATPFRFGELTALLTNDNGKINQKLVEKINSTGGFRLQSYSDFQIQNYVDVLQVLFEAGTLGLNGHAYTKVPAFLEATEGTNLKRNISIFMYKDGNEWKLDRNDSFPYSLEEIYDIVNNDKSGNTSIIAVSQNADMSAWIMANDFVGYGIPFHKSGLKMGTVRDTIVREGGREIKGYKGTIDHTKQQTEVWKETTADHKKETKVKNGINIYGFWDFENQGNLSKNELIKENIKKYIDECDRLGYLPKFRAYVMNNGKVLNDVLKYSKELGFVSQDATIEDISFKYKGYTIPYGYYKFLGDFGMFTPDGMAAPQQILSLDGYNFDKAEQFFHNAETLRRTEILQQFANGKVRSEYAESGMTTEELENVARQKRTEVAREALGYKHSMTKDTKQQSYHDYLDAVNSGDTDTAQRLLDDFAKDAGYNYRGVHRSFANFTVFDREKIGSNAGTRLGDGFYVTLEFKDDATAKYADSAYGENRMDLYVKMESPLVLGTPFDERIVNKMEEDFSEFGWFGEDSTSYYAVTPEKIKKVFQSSDRYEQMETIRLIADRNGMKISELLKQYGFDSVIDENDYVKQAVVFDETQLKSAEPVTYDEYGDVIMPYERFNKDNMDIRYSMTRAKELENAYLYDLENDDLLGAELVVEEMANLAMPDSKIRDNKGRLIPVYHGTNADFWEFDTSADGGKNGTAEGFGIYLSDNQEVTNAYGDRQIKMFANITKPATSFKKTIKASTLVKLIKQTCERQAKQMVEEEGYDSIRDAIRDTWVSNYVDTYGTSMDYAYREVAQSMLEQNDNDKDIIHEVMFGMAIRSYDQAMDFYKNSLTPVTGIDGFITKWDNANTGEMSNIYLAFDSSQLKSADAVTRDENGEVIPLSERFNPNKGDIRYSISKKGESDDFGYVPSRDIGYHDEFDDFAPIREDISKTETTTEESSVVADNLKATADTMGAVGDNIAPTDKEEKKAPKSQKSNDKTTAERRREKSKGYTDFWADLLGDTSTWVDMKTGLQYKTKTLRRILRKVVKDENGKPDFAKADAIYDELETKYDHNEALLKRESARLKEVFKKLNLSHAEDQYAQMLGELRYNPETTLTEDVVKEFLQKHKGINEKKVNEAIKESRKLYDDLIVRVNEVLREQGFKEIPYRQGYFPHFTNPKQNWVAKLLNWKTIDTEIPTSIAGLTEMFKPNRSWQSFNKQRKGDKTDYSLYQGLDTYIHGALDWIYHIEDLQKRRSLENYIRYTHSEEGVQKRIDEILEGNYDADEAQNMINAVLDEANNPLSGLVRELMNRTNTLANKKSSMDRAMEDMLNRKIYSTMTNLNNRVTANMVVGSFSSALTNFIPMVQSWHQVSPWYTVKGMGDFVRSAIKDDGMVEKSDFLTNRLVEEEKLYKTNWDKASDVAAFMMNAVDNITSQTVWRSKYLQNLGEGMSEAQAIRDADQFAKNLMAGRSRGNAPTIFDAKNPLVKMFTAFQLEVANQYGYMFEDVPQDSKNMARLVKGYATAFLGAYAYNALYSTMVGRDAAFDPISIMEDLMKGLFDDEEDEEDVLMDFGKDILEEVPFVGGLMGGGRVPISSAFPYSGYSNPIESMLNDLSDGELSREWLKPLYYLVLPFGGGQIKKTNEGLGMFSEEHPISGSYTASGRLRYPVEDTFGNRVQAAMFGQYANENARDYFDNNRSALTSEQLDEFMDLDVPIRDYWEYRDGLKGLSKTSEYADYINGLDLPISKKNMLINNLTDRKTPIDLSGYGKYDDFEEFDWATKNPEKYEFFKEIGVSYKDYKNANEEKKKDYNWAYDYPQYVTLSKAVTDDVWDYREYYKDMVAFKADKDANGKSISGTKKAKVIDYINSLDIEYGAKLVLLKSQYEAEDKYNKEIFEYIKGKSNLTLEEKKSILKTLGFRVSDDGKVSWD